MNSTDAQLDKLLLPEQELLEELSLCEENDGDIEHEVLMGAPLREEGPFSNSPDDAAEWMEHASEQYIAA